MQVLLGLCSSVLLLATRDSILAFASRMLCIILHFMLWFDVLNKLRSGIISASV